MKNNIRKYLTRMGYTCRYSGKTSTFYITRYRCADRVSKLPYSFVLWAVKRWAANFDINIVAAGQCS